MNKYQEYTVYITAVVFIVFLAISLITNRWGFFLWSLLPIFLNLMIAFFSDSKHIGRFNQKHAEKNGN